MGSRVAVERIDQYGADRRVREAALDREPHHLRAVAAAQVRPLADPDIDGAKACRDAAAPVAALLARRVDDLDEADRAPALFGDQLLAPVGFPGKLRLPAPVVADGGDDVGLPVPVT